MKRKNLDYPKLRRSSRRNKINENIYGSTFLYIKFFLIWAIVLLADFLLEFRFEYLWPFWLLLRSVYDSFKYQGLAFSIFFICIALTSDMICLLSIPVHWLFFAASTYVWVQFIWHTERGICLPTISLWLLFVYIEASVRLRELKNVPFHLDLCRPFAAHCIGYPMVTLGFGFKSYIGYRLRQKKQRDIAKENDFFHELLQKALPNDVQQKEFDLADALSSYTNNSTERSAPKAHNLSNGSAAKQLLANSLDDYSLSCNGDFSSGPEPPYAQALPAPNAPTHRRTMSNGHCNGAAPTLEHKRATFNASPPPLPPGSSSISHRLATFLFSTFTTTKNDFCYALRPPERHSFLGGDVVSSLTPDPPRSGKDEALEPKRGASGKKNASSVAGTTLKSVKFGESELLFPGEPGDDIYMEMVKPASNNAPPPPLLDDAAAVSGSVGGSFCLNDLTPTLASSSSFSGGGGKQNNAASPTYKRLSKNSNFVETYLQKESQINPSNNVFKDDNIASSKITSSAKDDIHSNSIKLELELKKYKSDLQASRTNEQDLREQIGQFQISEKGIKQELTQLRQDNESLQNKIYNLVTLKQQDKLLMASLEKKLTDEQKYRAKLETQIIDKKVQVKRQNDETLMLLNGKPNMVGECNDICKNRRKDLENDIRQLCRDAKSREDQIWILEKELQTLRQLKDKANENDILLTALSALKNKNIHLETSLNAETKLKLDLFSALSEAKRNLEINQSLLAKRDNEVADLKSKVAEIMAVLPGPTTPASISLHASPRSNSSGSGNCIAATTTSRYSPLAPGSPSPRTLLAKDGSPFYASLFSPSSTMGSSPSPSSGAGGMIALNNGCRCLPTTPSPPNNAMTEDTNGGEGNCGFSTTTTCNNNFNGNHHHNNANNSNGIDSAGLKMDQLHHKLNPSAAIYNPLLSGTGSSP